MAQETLFDVSWAFFVCFPSSSLSLPRLPSFRPGSVLVWFGGGVAVLLVFIVARIPTPRAVARGGGWWCFRGPVGGRRRCPDVVSLL
jgi:hypothetical protein